MSAEPNLEQPLSPDAQEEKLAREIQEAMQAELQIMEQINRLNKGPEKGDTERVELEELMTQMETTQSRINALIKQWQNVQRQLTKAIIK